MLIGGWSLICGEAWGGGGEFRFPEVGISATVQKSVILRDITKSRFSSGYHVTGSNFPDNKEMA